MPPCWSVVIRMMRAAAADLHAEVRARGWLELVSANVRGSTDRAVRHASVAGAVDVDESWSRRRAARTLPLGPVMPVFATVPLEARMRTASKAGLRRSGRCSSRQRCYSRT